MEKEELVNEGITRMQKVDFDEKEHIAEAANILEEEETIKMQTSIAISRINLMSDDNDNISQ